MIENYIPLFIIIGAALIFGVIAVNASRLFGPQRPNREKMTTYESGVEPVRSARERFSVKYYIVAMLFIVAFFLGWGLREARRNDRLIEQGKRDEILKDMQR